MKKMFSAILAAGLMVLPFGTVSLTANASQQYVLLGDANNDGVVGISDAIVIANYIYGNITPNSDYQITAMDANNDYVIDISDVYRVQQIEAGSMPETTVYKYLYTAPDNSLRYYYRHDCSDTNPSGKYLYSISNIPAMSTAEDEAKIMAKLEELSSRGYLQNDTSHGSTVEVIVGTKKVSGIFINNNVIATAAENIYDYSTGEFKSDVVVNIFNDSGNTLLASEDALYLHIPQLYDTTSGDAKRNYNYGLIYIDSDVSCSEPDLGFTTESFDFTWHNVTACGYDGNGTRKNSTGYIIAFTDGMNGYLRSYRMTMLTEVIASMSGGSIYYNYDNAHTSVVGLLNWDNTESNDSEFAPWGVRMTPTVQKFYEKNTYLTQGGTYLW